MARTEARIFTSIWDHEDDFVSRSPVAQRAYFLILSQRGLNYCGVIDYAPKRWAALAKGDSVAAMTKAVAELERERYVVIDRDTDELWVRTFVRRDGVLGQPQLVKAMMTDFGAVASATIRGLILEGLGEGFLEGLPGLFPKAFRKGSTQGIPEPFRKAFAKAFPAGSSRSRGGARPHDHAPPPLPPPPPLEPAGNPSVNGATNGHAGVGKSEEDLEKPLPPPSAGDEPVEHEKLRPLAEHLAEGLWPGRPRMLAESVVAVGQCLAVADAAVVDECIGAMLSAEDKPRSPKYLVTTVRNRLVAMGAYAVGDEALATLGSRS